jgi:hypothetical protein
VSIDEGTAAQRVLGIGFGDLGQGIAKSWGLPEALQRAMRAPEGGAPSRSLPASGLDRQRWLARLSIEVADAVLDSEDAATRQRRIEAVAEGYARALGVKPEQVHEASQAAQERLAQLAQAMQIRVSNRARARRLIAVPDAAPPEPDTLAPHTLQATDVAPPRRRGERVGRAPRQCADPRRRRTAGAGRAGHHPAHGWRQLQLNEVLRMILETMLRALGFRRLVFCLRDGKTQTLTGRFGLGEGASEVARTMRIPLAVRAGAAPDLFVAVCAKGADTLIADATKGSIAARLPRWFVQQVQAPSFLLLPLMLEGACFALMYADHEEPGGIKLGEKELALLRTLRNQGVMAFRQVG